MYYNQTQKTKLTFSTTSPVQTALFFLARSQGTRGGAAPGRTDRAATGMSRALQVKRVVRVVGGERVRVPEYAPGAYRRRRRGARHRTAGRRRLRRQGVSVLQSLNVKLKRIIDFFKISSIYFLNIQSVQMQNNPRRTNF